MAIKRREEVVKTDKSNSKQPDGLKCSVCDVVVPRKDVLYPDRMLHHCTGSKIALGCYLHDPHHTTIEWLPCWKCKGSMGCWNCMPGQKWDDENGITQYTNNGLWCQRCHVATNFETVREHGLPAGFRLDSGTNKLVFGKAEGEWPNIKAYPPELQHAYFQHCAANNVSVDASAEEAFMEFRKAAMNFRAKRIPMIPGKKSLERERNRQVAELGASE